MAGNGLRTLALARRTLPEDVALDEDVVEADLTLLGVVGIIDPPRPEVPQAVQTAHEAGIRVVMITGDAAATAKDLAVPITAVAKEYTIDGVLDAMQSVTKLKNK